MEKSVKRFTKETEDFLWGISLNNYREWFMEHKDTYTNCVYEPLKALMEDVWQRLEEKCIEGTTCRCSRIYRDARRLHGRGPYKDHLWFTISSGDRWTVEPVFYFEISPYGGNYGLGCYWIPAEQLTYMRNVIDANPQKCERLIEEITEKGLFTIGGEDYKRPKGSFGTSADLMYNKRHLDFCRELKWGKELMSPDLGRKMAKHLETLVPMYEYMKTFIAPIDLRKRREKEE